jgi:hypothetical protein
MNDWLNTLHKQSANHRAAIWAGKYCGCFHCLRRFSPYKIKEWIDDGETALCPFCGMDAVLPKGRETDANLSKLGPMRDHWFAIHL